MAKFVCGTVDRISVRLELWNNVPKEEPARRFGQPGLELCGLFRVVWDETRRLNPPTTLTRTAQMLSTDALSASDWITELPSWNMTPWPESSSCLGSFWKLLLHFSLLRGTLLLFCKLPRLFGSRKSWSRPTQQSHLELQAGRSFNWGLKTFRNSAFLITGSK